MQPTAAIKHPQIPEITITAQLPRQGDRIRLEQYRERAGTRATAVYELDGKTPVLKRNGEVQTMVVTVPMTVDIVDEILKAYIIGIEGVPTHDGKTLNFPPDKKEAKADRDKAIADGVLWDDHLDVSLPAGEVAKLVGMPVPTDEAQAAHLIKMPLARYLSFLVTDRETYDKDQSGNA